LQQTIGAAEILIDTAQRESPRARLLVGRGHQESSPSGCRVMTIGVCVSVETNPTISSPFCGVTHSSSPSSRYFDEFNDVIVIAALWLG
jgi:hypothetical protein